MATLKTFSEKPLRVSTLLLTGALLLTGCAADGSKTSAPDLFAGVTDGGTSSKDKTVVGSAEKNSAQEGLDGDTDNELPTDGISEPKSDPKAEKEQPEIPGRGPVETEKTPSLAPTFPKKILPEKFNNKIYDSGSWGEGQWFVVLEVSDLAEAEAIVSDIVSVSKLTQESSDSSADGGTVWELSAEQYEILAISLRDKNETFLSIEVSEKD